MPANKEKLIKACIEIHKEDLMANWALAVTGNSVFKIDPLKWFVMNPRVAEVKYKHPYKLTLTLNNGELKEFDFVSYLNYPVYEKLKNPIFCSTVKVFLGTAVWDDDIDFAPDTLYLESKPVLEPAT